MKVFRHHHYSVELLPVGSTADFIQPVISIKLTWKFFCSTLLYTQLNRFMPLRTFHTWRNRETIPLADQIVPIIAQRGAQGMSRGEIGRLVPLERDTLDDLLDGFVRAGMLVVTDVNGVRAYRRQA